MNATIDEGRYSVCMTSLQTPTVRVGDSDPGAVDSNVLEQADAVTYAQWFACLAEPMRVRLLKKIREERRFASLDELRRQIEADYRCIRDMEPTI